MHRTTAHIGNSEIQKIRIIWNPGLQWRQSLAKSPMCMQWFHTFKLTRLCGPELYWAVLYYLPKCKCLFSGSVLPMWCWPATDDKRYAAGFRTCAELCGNNPLCSPSHCACTRLCFWNQETGFLVEKDNHNDVIEKISLLLDDQSKRYQMGVAGHQFVKNNFSWEQITKRFIEIMNNSISQD